MKLLKRKMSTKKVKNAKKARFGIDANKAETIAGVAMVTAGSGILLYKAGKKIYKNVKDKKATTPEEPKTKKPKATLLKSKRTTPNE